MIRLYVFAEGSTEQAFADEVLKPHLAKSGVYLQNAVQIAHARKKRKIHRGGGRKYEPMKNDINRFLAQEKGGDVRFTTMIDLFAIAEMPGNEAANKLTHLPYERVKSLEKSFAQDINDSRFIPYIQLHEYEAYLFSDPSYFAYFYEIGSEKKIESLVKLAKDRGPELINDCDPPSKRIIECFNDYDKVLMGTQIAQLIGLDTIRQNCPHFAEWLTMLESLN